MKKICLPQTVYLRIFIFSAIMALTGVFSTPQLDAEIYKWIDENGEKHYSNMPPANAGDVEIVFGEIQHDEAADQEPVKADQIETDALVEKNEKEKRQTSEVEQEKLEEAKQDHPPLFASGCFSPSYSVQQGRGVNEAIIPRDFAKGEYQNLQKLFQSLEGNWEGNASVIVCEETQDKVRKVVDNYLIKSEGKMSSTGQFDIKATLHSQKKNETRDESLYLYLDPKKLALEPNISIGDIELISVSSNELAYVEKTQNRSESGGSEMHEKVTTIKKTGEESFTLERILYYNGRLIKISTWHLENK